MKSKRLSRAKENYWMGFLNHWFMEPVKQQFLISQQQALRGNNNETAYPIALAVKRFQNLRAGRRICFLLLTFTQIKFIHYRLKIPQKKNGRSSGVMNGYQNS